MRISLIHNSPFRFLELPAEIRNTIYKFAATPQAGIDDTSSSIELASEDTGLFATCKQTRAEGLVFFYRNQTFNFCLRDGLYFLLKWLDGIGEIGRMNIRHLTINTDFALGFNPETIMKNMTYVHEKLSDEATAIWVSNRLTTSQHLYNIWMAFADKDEEHCPMFENGDMDLPTTRRLALSPLYKWADKTSLIFYPGMSWFGHQQAGGEDGQQNGGEGTSECAQGYRDGCQAVDETMFTNENSWVGACVVGLVKEEGQQ